MFHYPNSITKTSVLLKVLNGCFDSLPAVNSDTSLPIKYRDVASFPNYRYSFYELCRFCRFYRWSRNVYSFCKSIGKENQIRKPKQPNLSRTNNLCIQRKSSVDTHCNSICVGADFVFCDRTKAITFTFTHHHRSVAVFPNVQKSPSTTNTRQRWNTWLCFTANT